MFVLGTASTIKGHARIVAVAKDDIILKTTINKAHFKSRIFGKGKHAKTILPLPHKKRGHLILL